MRQITRDEIKTGVTLKERINQEVKESKEIDKLIQENVNRFVYSV
ncbi:MAG: hypothetical protein VKJ02_02150 [Snowella sp.]|nr:hypothetical protein [Snowella sp.]